MRVKRIKKVRRAVKAPRSIRSKKPASAAVSTNYSWVTSSRAIVSAMIFVVVAATLLTAREDAPRVDAGREQLPPAATTVESEFPRALEATKAVTSKPSTTVMSEPLAASTAQPIEPLSQPESAAEPEGVASATITGCLERDEGTFRLTDASGADTPTSRSWKSGFLKKRPAHIELADGVGTLNLRNLIGRRVAASGTLVDRELRARSVRPVGTCE